MLEQKSHIEEEGHKYDMNIFDNYDHVVEALKAMEGERWFEIQEIVGGENSINGAIHNAKLLRSEFECAVILGAGGYDRFQITREGFVYFSSYSGNVNEAKKHGFECR